MHSICVKRGQYEVTPNQQASVPTMEAVSIETTHSSEHLRAGQVETIVQLTIVFINDLSF